ncbi:MAG: MFS transporter [Proteobacteria bacterium]|nr:MFS transporter [Pseudomonadota bacterium]
MRRGLDSTEAWIIAVAALVVLSTSFGAPYIVTVALKTIAAEFGGERSIPAAAGSLAWLGTGVGGLLMGLVAERIGTRATVVFGACMLAAGLTLAGQGGHWQLFVGHGLLIGLLGNGAINAPLYVYVSRWFEQRRGTAVALIASGQYAAGAIWPPIFERALTRWSWQQVMAGFAVIAAAVVIPLALGFLREPPATAPSGTSKAGARSSPPGPVTGLSPNVLFVSLMLASFLCCIPMAMPSAHLIAFCGDLGMSPAKGAAMLSLLLVTAFISRQFWGWLSDRIGGLLTLLICSAAQAVGVAGFLVTQDEAGLFAVAAGFGMGFSGLIPAYLLTARTMFPAREAPWRMPSLLLTGMTGMATGSWLAGVIYDRLGSYTPAFATGLAANLANLVILTVVVLAWRQALARERTAPPIAATGPLT